MNTNERKTKNIVQLLTELNEYSWERFLVSYDELLSDIEPLDELIKKETEQAGYIALYADKNLDSRSNFFYPPSSFPCCQRPYMQVLPLHMLLRG